MQDIAATQEATVNVVIGDAPADRRGGTLVSGNYFSLLGTRPAIGRLLAAHDDVAKGAHPVLVLSWSYWQEAFGGERSVVGRTVRINRMPFEVIGVTPRGFKGESFDRESDFWLSLAMTDVAQPDWIDLQPLERRGFAWLDLVARMKPGSTLEQVQGELTSIARAAEPDAEPKRSMKVLPATAATIGIDQASAASQLSWILLGVVALVLLLACADVAALLLARAEARRRELGVRLALGATRGRLIRQLLAESLLLAFAGAAGGLAVAALLRRAVVALAPADFLIPIASATPMLDLRMLGLTAGIALGVRAFLRRCTRIRSDAYRIAERLRGQVAGLRVFRM